jgi:hypothetical protein
MNTALEGAADFLPRLSEFTEMVTQQQELLQLSLADIRSLQERERRLVPLTKRYLASQDTVRASAANVERLRSELRAAEEALAVRRAEAEAIAGEVAPLYQEAREACTSLVQGVTDKPGISSDSVGMLNDIFAKGARTPASSIVLSSGTEHSSVQEAQFATAPMPAPRAFDVSTQIGGVNVLAWNYEDLNSLPDGMEYEVAVAVGSGLHRSVPREPLPAELRDHPEKWHYLIRTRRNPLQHRVTYPDGKEVGNTKGVLMWYCVRVAHGETKGEWSEFIAVECNQWKTSSSDKDKQNASTRPSIFRALRF